MQLRLINALPKLKKKLNQKYKRDDAINLFRDAGIPNPESFYLDFEKTQKSIALEHEEINNVEFSGRTKKGKKDVYDDALGF
jgi:hypothetical protein